MSNYEEYDDYADFANYTDPDLARHKKSDRVKWIVTAVAFVLVFALVIGLCVAFIPHWGSDTTTFNVTLSAYKTVKEDDVKGCKSLTYSTDAGDEEICKLLLVSYDERTKECVLLLGVLPEDTDASKKIEGDEAGMLIFVRAFDVEAAELKQLGSYQAFKRLALEKEYVVAVNLMGESQGRWANAATLLFGTVEEESTELSFIDAPTAQLKFKAEGTFKPSDDLMKILTGEV